MEEEDLEAGKGSHDQVENVLVDMDEAATLSHHNFLKDTSITSIPYNHKKKLPLPNSGSKKEVKRYPKARKWANRGASAVTGGGDLTPGLPLATTVEPPSIDLS